MRKLIAFFILFVVVSIIGVAFADSSIQVGDEIAFGIYEQDNNHQNGKEPITWIVLEVDNKNDRLLVISKYLLDCVMYNQNTKSTKWEKTTLGQWIENTFIPEAFSDADQLSIISTKVSGSMHKVFILSEKEIRKYMESFLCSPTQYAIARGMFTSKVDGITRSSYWLRLDTSSTWGAFVGSKGGIYTKNNKVTVKDNGVRPAMYLSMNYDRDTVGAIPSDLRVGQRVTIDENTSVQLNSFNILDALGYYGKGSSSGKAAGYYESGAEAEYVVVKMSLKNNAPYSQDYMTGTYVELVYDGGYRFGGWIHQLANNSDSVVLNSGDRYTIESGQTGYFCFGCTVPNMVVNGSAPTQMIVHLLDTDIVYNIR